jgi:hypothetical protein
MPVLSDQCTAEYLGNGAQEFPIPFRYLEKAHIRAFRIAADLSETELTQGADYLLSDADAPTGGTLFLGTALAVGTKLRIDRDVPYTQPLDMRTQGSFSPVALTTALDREEMQIQQLKRDLARAAAAPVYAPGNHGGFAARVDADVARAPTANLGAATVEHNDATVYNGGTGRFTCPQAGRYVVRAAAHLKALTPSDSACVNLRKNGADLVALGSLGGATIASLSAGMSEASSVVEATLTLAAGDYIEAMLAVQTDAVSVTLAALSRFEAHQLLLV